MKSNFKVTNKPVTSFQSKLMADSLTGTPRTLAGGDVTKQKAMLNFINAHFRLQHRLQHSYGKIMVKCNMLLKIWRKNLIILQHSIWNALFYLLLLTFAFIEISVYIFIQTKKYQFCLRHFANLTWQFYITLCHWCVQREVQTFWSSCKIFKLVCFIS